MLQSRSGTINFSLISSSLRQHPRKPYARKCSNLLRRCLATESWTLASLMAQLICVYTGSCLMVITYKEPWQCQRCNIHSVLCAVALVFL